MIKKYNQFIKESILDELKGPSEKEYFQVLKKLTPGAIITKSITDNFLPGVKYAVKEFYNTLEWVFILQIACFRRKPEIVTYLLTHVEYTKFQIEIVIDSAIENDYRQILRDYINKEKLTENLLDELKGPTEEEIWNNFKNLNPNELLVKSSEVGFLNGVKKALELGADIHYNNDLALRFAALKGHLNVVKYLVEHGADIHSDNDHALIYAANTGHLNVVKYFVENGANIHASNDQALRIATVYKYLDIIEYIKSKM